MGIQITCVNPITGETTTINAQGVGVSGGSQALYPNLMAKRINLRFAEVQQTIAEGRAAGFKPFSIEGNGTGVGEGKPQNRG
jgi:hypothetical protein